MAEVGIDISDQQPKQLTTDAVEASDVVITMGCGDACPVFPGKRYLDWQLADPAGKGVEAVRPIRDEIDRRIRGLLPTRGRLHGRPPDPGGGAAGRGRRGQPTAFPGLRMSSGSSAAFTARCIASTAGPSSRCIPGRLSRPTPCSPVT